MLNWLASGIVNWFKYEMKSHPEYIPGFLELLTILPEVYIKKGNVNECRTALVKNLIKESFYGKRKKSN